MSEAVTPTPQQGQELDFFLGIAARILMRSSDPRDFLDWAADAGPTLMPGMAAAVEGDPGEFFRVLGRMLRDAMPLADFGFRPSPLPKPGRNDPCTCGSGRKYKHCCLPLEGAVPPLAEVNLLRYVLDSMPAKDLAELASSAANPDAVWDTARQWLEEGETKRAIALLEPWFADGRELTGRLDAMFDLLMDCYLRGRQETKRKRLIERVLARGDRELRAAAMQRRTTMLADKGKREETWASFREAQREDPSSPGLAHLEVTLLAGEGDFDRAAQRARFWIAALERQRDPQLSALIGFLREIAADPRGTMAQLGRADFPGSERLKEMLDHAPALSSHHRFEPLEGSTGPILPDRVLARAEAGWRNVFPRMKPWLTSTGHGDASVWHGAERWLDVLAATPELWQSFDVLDDLAMAVDALPMIGGEHGLLEPILERGVALLRLELERSAAREKLFEWSWMQNRPALRLAAHLAFRHYGAGDWRRFTALAEWILALNPPDNHGLRDNLSLAYLELDEPGRVLELWDRYKGGGTALTMNAVLAQWRCGRTAEALATLAEASTCTAAVRMLLAEDPKPPRLREDGVIVGGKDEAWIYRMEARGVWERDGALAWLRQASKGGRAKPG